MRAATASTFLFPALAIVAGLLWLPAADVEAYQPEGLRISLSEMPEPPCPYGHDDACENAAGPAFSVKPYQSDDPHAPALGAAAGPYDHHEGWESIAHLNRQAVTRFDRASNGATAGEDEPDGSDNGVSYAITSDILGLPWVTSNPTAAERLTLAWLAELQDHNPSLVASLVRMPFLQDHTPGDLQAIQTLTIISGGTAVTDPNPQYATSLVGRASLADGGGIDNTEAKIIAVTSILYLRGMTGSINLFADFGTVEEQNVTGQYGNALTFGVVRLATTKQNSELMRSATSATGHAEILMGQALPVDFIGILVADSADFAGANNGINIQVDSGFDGTYSDRFRQLTVAHEIGHYYWGTGDNYLHEDWISEGAAEYIAAYSAKTQFGDSGLWISNYPCPYYRTIEHLRADNPHYRFSQGSQCYYSLGEGLFINLDRSMGHTAFTAGFRNLHQRLSTYEDDWIDQGLSLVRAFCSQCLTPNARLGEVGHTLARRYGEKVLADSSAADGTIAGLGSSPSVSLRDYGHVNRQYGIPEVSASSPDQRRWIRLFFSNPTNPPETVTVAVKQYYEDRNPYYAYWQDRTVWSIENGGAWFYVYLGNPPRRAIGHHWVYVYNESLQKIAEAEYQVVP